jgi:chromosome partitioning protein
MWVLGAELSAEVASTGKKAVTSAVDNLWRAFSALQSRPMRCIALINQKGGVGKTTTTANLGAALALAGKRVVVVDLDPQANLTLYLGLEVAPEAPSSYRVLTGEVPFGSALRTTSTPNLRCLPTDLHLSGAEPELSSTQDRERLLRKSIAAWRDEHRKKHRGQDPADYVLFDCPPSLGLLSLNALAAADEVFLVVQTQFLALQGLTKLLEVIELVKQKLHPGLKLAGIVACLYDSRMRLAREVLSELRQYFPALVFRTAISSNVKLAESPSFGKTIFEYAPESIGARDFAALSHEVLSQEVLPKALAGSPEEAAPKKARAPLVPAASRPAPEPPKPVEAPEPKPRRAAGKTQAAVPAPAPDPAAPPAPTPPEILPARRRPRPTIA